MNSTKLWLSALPLLAVVVGGLQTAGGPAGSGLSARHGSSRSLADTGWGATAPSAASHQVTVRDTGWG
ncbi:hypothetical protein [Streptantibioticus ferralitis]|uniref:Uncharacterized protein n=1 Tax=Streptantibioticus ferralitis TaxID=236510 RepID=A0ABT5YYB2_9ACTN|nr:hypothetical protein [Streptantibioticus ferralitis]MDF2256306.1 hypothetical protein [Streptantibioticus ferralitis]